MTVRVFSQVPPDRVRTLWVDPDSHTSVALARILWRELYVRDLALRTFDPVRRSRDDVEAVLLIGDKVVDPQRGSFAYEVDLGGAWRQHTGLPFVFAVWAVKDDGATARGATAVSAVGSGITVEQTSCDELAQVLSTARDRGVAQAASIAEIEGPQHGWPVELAQRYLTRCLKYTLDARAVEGANLFARYCASADLAPADAEISWPPALRPSVAGAST